MAVTETREIHTPNWLERMGSSFKGILTGLVLIAASALLLFWNEGRAVKTARRLSEGAGAVVSVPSDKVDSANEGKLVHVSGRAETKDVLTDPQFGLSVTALKLKRQVEIFQWVEHTETRQVKKGDKTYEETTYTYKQEWCSKPVDSSGFKEAGHGNPPTVMPFTDQELLAPNVTLGAFKLSEANVKRIGGSKAYDYPQDFKLPEALKRAKLVNGVIYVPALKAAATAPTASSSGGSPLLAAAQAAASNAVETVVRDASVSPAVGDLRVTVRVTEPHDISLCQKQVGDTFMPWPASDGKTIALQQDGLADAAAMFADAQTANTRLTWILRLVGFVLMFAGFKGVFGPISTLVDVIPILNQIVSAGVGLVSFLLALGGSLLTAGLAWIVYRPVLGIALVGLAVGCVVLVFLKKKGKVDPVK